MKFGRLTPVAYIGGSKWHCICSCGRPSQVKASALKEKSIVSCGCYSRDIASERGKKCAKHGMYGSPEYRAWGAMINRCTNPKDPQWDRYGGRGVRVCPEWKNFAAFFRDMGPRPSSKHSLDRADNGLLYSKATCRWATTIEQQNNTRNNRRITHEGNTRTIAEWARLSGIRYQVLRNRINAGWPMHKALTTPVIQRSSK